MDSKFKKLLDTHFKKSASGDIGKVSMDSDMLKLLLAIDARLPLSQVARKAGIAQDQLKKSVVKLVRLGLVETAARKAPAIGEPFSRGLKANMVKAVGPFGEFIVQDVINATGYSANDLPVSQAADIITTLSQEIADEEARYQFKQAMINLISKA